MISIKALVILAVTAFNLAVMPRFVTHHSNTYTVFRKTISPFLTKFFLPVILYVIFMLREFRQKEGKP